ncbi:MAG: VCBS repeat-containing protein, partial [Myxococcales bacterium]
DRLNVQGNRLMTADLDGDGYPDLLVHRIGTTARTVVATAQADSAKWSMRILMNRPGPDGGRTFVDATVDSGYGVLPGATTSGPELRVAHLAAAADVDNDGDLDLFSGTTPDPTADETKTPDTGDRSQILLNDGHGVFTLAPPSDVTPPLKPRLPTSGATFVDADRDGKIDLFVGFWYRAYGESDFGAQAQLYRGNGDGTFTLATEPAGLKTKATGGNKTLAEGANPRPAYGVTSCDLDDDGAPELMVSAYGRQWNLLYRNDGKGAFSEVGQPSGFAGDDNRDYTSNEFFACYCTVHPDAVDCEGVKAPQLQCPTPADAAWRPGIDDQPWRSNGNTFSTFCGDIDGDGRNDLYNAEIHHWWAGAASDSSQVLRNVSGAEGLR